MKCEACDQPYMYQQSSAINHRLCSGCQIEAVVWAAKQARRERTEIAAVDEYCMAGLTVTDWIVNPKTAEGSSIAIHVDDEPVINLNANDPPISDNPFLTSQRGW